MGIIEILLDIGLHLVEAIFEFIWGIIWTIIEYCWPPILIVVAIWLVYLYTKVNAQGTGKPHEIGFDDGTVIGYKTEPPNFR